MQSKLKSPNFFIVGAPKCGTTSLTEWLSGHPNIFMCNPKEPYFFSKDIKRQRAAITIQDYQKLFINATANHKIIGEASTNYLRSTVAIQNILMTIENPRFLVCLRNPIDLAISAHAQLVKTGHENIVDFKKAWTVQTDRRQGKYIPWYCKEPSIYQYHQNCLLGEQVERMLNLVNYDNVHFVLLDDMIANPKLVYIDILNFLDLDYDFREDFNKLNTRMEHKLPVIQLIF